MRLRATKIKSTSSITIQQYTPASKAFTPVKQAPRSQGNQNYPLKTTLFNKKETTKSIFNKQTHCSNIQIVSAMVFLTRIKTLVIPCSSHKVNKATLFILLLSMASSKYIILPIWSPHHLWNKWSNIMDKFQIWSKVETHRWILQGPKQSETTETCWIIIKLLCLDCLLDLMNLGSPIKYSPSISPE